MSLETEFADRLQEMRLLLWRAYPRYRHGTPFSTWMHRVALNGASSQLRADGLSGRKANDLMALAGIAPSTKHQPNLKTPRRPQ